MKLRSSGAQCTRNELLDVHVAPSERRLLWVGPINMCSSGAEQVSQVCDYRFNGLSELRIPKAKRNFANR
jgi:hypothetical protein